jgi:hypothetical protein
VAAQVNGKVVTFPDRRADASVDLVAGAAYKALGRLPRRPPCSRRSRSRGSPPAPPAADSLYLPTPYLPHPPR